MSKLDEKLKASIKPKHGKTAAPIKGIAAAKPAAKPATAMKPEKKSMPAPAKASSAKPASKPSALFPERVWPD
jgi:hypothetical protein